MITATANRLVHLELHSPDPQSAARYYAALLGWPSERVEAAGKSYLAMDAGGIGGGIVECAAPTPLWLPYVEVPDVAAATSDAERLGARVLLAPREGPAGWRSVVADRSGAEIAFWQPKR